MTNKAWLILLGICGGTVLAHAQPTPLFIESDTRRLEILGDIHPGTPRVDASQARLVFYSPEDLAIQGVTSVFINGTYHASLGKGAYSDLCLRPGTVELGVRRVEPNGIPDERPDTSFNLQLQGGQTHFLRVRASSGRPVLQLVSSAQAERELSGKRKQIHTISRVAQACIQGVPPAVPAAPSAAVLAPVPTKVQVPARPLPAAASPRRHTLAADMLFPSGRSDRKSMSVQGLRAIDRLIAHLNKAYTRIDLIAIEGHADPMGNTALNERLAQERADTVRQYIEPQLPVRTRITAVGRGSRDPVVSDCSRKNTPDALACNLPNRRVEIEVTGLDR